MRDYSVDPIWPSKPQNNLDQLNSAFLEAMNDIGRYGFTLYGPLPRVRSAHHAPERVTSAEIVRHACTHGNDYLQGVPHDHFGTVEMQLAAVAFNAMMEFRFLMAERAAASAYQYKPGERQASAALKPGCVHFFNRSRGVCIYCDGAMPDEERSR